MPYGAGESTSPSISCATYGTRIRGDWREYGYTTRKIQDAKVLDEVARARVSCYLAFYLRMANAKKKLDAD